MTVGKGASLDVLAAQAHVDALLEERAERHGFAQGPVHLPLLDHLHSRLQDPFDTYTHKRNDKTIVAPHTDLANTTVQDIDDWQMILFFAIGTTDEVR